MSTAAEIPVIERYGPGGFAISGVVFTGPVLVLPDQALAWDVTGYAEITLESLAPAAAHGGIELLLIGTGERMRAVPAELRRVLRLAGIGVDGMATAAACRTYGVLAAERRRVAAALLPIRF